MSELSGAGRYGPESLRDMAAAIQADAHPRERAAAIGNLRQIADSIGYDIIESPDGITFTKRP